MAYTKQTWECGDVITAEKLNHMEDGIANSGGGTALIIEFDRAEEVCPEGQTGTLTLIFNHTGAEVWNAITSGSSVYIKGEDGNNTTLTEVQEISEFSGSYSVRFPDSVVLPNGEPFLVSVPSLYDGYLFSSDCHDIL